MLLVLAAALILSCNEEDAKPAFKMQHQFDFTIQPGLNVFETHFFPIKNIPSAFQIEANAADVELADVKSVHSGRVTLYPAFSNHDLSILEEVVVNVYPTAELIDRHEAAYSFQIPTREINRLDLAASLTNLLEVFDRNRYSIEIGLRFRATTQQEMNLRLEIEFNAFL